MDVPFLSLGKLEAPYPVIKINSGRQNIKKLNHRKNNVFNLLFFFFFFLKETQPKIKRKKIENFIGHNIESDSAKRGSNHFFLLFSFFFFFFWCFSY
jgi:hypothetical protein